MKFKSRDEKLAWLKATGGKIQEMEYQRRIAIVSGDFGKAYSLLAGIQFARTQFRKVSNTLKKF
jgi:hypothetical protein